MIMQTLCELALNATGVTCSSDNVRPGFIFVAIRGRQNDGNMFARIAAQRGALAVVSDCPGTLHGLTIPVIAVQHARLALSELAAAFYGNPSHDLRLIGVTGSNGKTTITCMLEHIFLQAGLSAGLIGTVRVNTGKTIFASTLTTPDAVTVHDYLAKMRKNNVTHAAMEVSAQGVDMHRVAHVHFTTGVLTNICADHLDFHGNFANYLAAKTKFLSLLASNTPLIVNIADAQCQAIASQFSGELVTVSASGPADITAQLIHSTSYGSTFILDITKRLSAPGGHQVPAGRQLVRLPLAGRHNIENGLLAAAAALVNGISPASIADALAIFPGVERRLNIFHLAGLTIVDDTALNPGSIDAVFATVAEFRYNRLLVVNAIRGQRGSAINAANAAAIAGQRRNLPFELVITASTGHVDAANTVTDKERCAFLTTLDTQKVNYTYTNTLPAAIKTTLNNAVPGDLVLLIGAQGMDAGRQVLTTLATSADGRTYVSESFIAGSFVI